MGIRAELLYPGLQILDPDKFNQLTTSHGLVMVFGAVMPAFELVEDRNEFQSMLTSGYQFCRNTQPNMQTITPGVVHVRSNSKTPRNTEMHPGTPVISEA